jgi:hypothetical protein
VEQALGGGEGMRSLLLQYNSAREVRAESNGTNCSMSLFLPCCLILPHVSALFPIIATTEIPSRRPLTYRLPWILVLWIVGASAMLSFQLVAMMNLKVTLMSSGQSKYQSMDATYPNRYAFRHQKINSSSLHARGEELFLEASNSSPRKSCQRLDDLENFEGFQKTKSPRLFTDCMDDLEAAQKAFQRQQQGECKETERIHAMWKGPLRPTARLGILSFLYSSGPCTKLTMWVIDNATEKALQEGLPSSHTLRLEIQRLDFGDLCDRIVKWHPHLDKLISKSRQNLLQLSNPSASSQPTGFSDVVRVFVLAAHGGVYLDCDMLLLRPLTPLLGRDFYYRWSTQNYCNTAVFHLREGSRNAAVLLEMALSKSNHGQAGPLTRALFPSDLYRNIGNSTTIDMLPSAYFDPLWVVMDVYGEGAPAAKSRYGLNNFHRFFTEKNEMDEDSAHFFPGAFAFHWHNQWKVNIEKGSSADLFLRHYEQMIAQAQQQQ